MLQPSIAGDGFEGYDKEGVPFFIYDGSKHGVKVDDRSGDFYVWSANHTIRYYMNAGRDFSVGGTKVAKNSGDYSVQIVGEGSFTGTYLADWKIAKAQNTTASVKYGDSEATSEDNTTVFRDTYNGKTIADKIKVDVGNGGSDYTVKYFLDTGNSWEAVSEEDTKNAGSYRVSVTIPETQNYAETTISFQFRVYKREVEVGSVNLEKTTCAYGEEIPKITGFEFTGEQQPLEEDLKQFTADLISSYEYDAEGKHYGFEPDLFGTTASYKNYTVAGVPDSAKITFESASIENAVVTTAKLALKADGWTNLNSGVVKVEYTMPDGTVKELVKGTDFEFFDDYRTKNAGTYPIILEGIGDFTGEVEVEVEVAVANAELASSNTILYSDNIVMNFFATIEDEDFVDGAYVLFKYNHYGEDVEIKVDVDKTNLNKGRYVFPCSLSALEMSIEITAELYLRDMSEPISVKSRSISDYAHIAAQKASTEVERNVAKALLNYGAYTQISQNYMTDALPNTGLEIDVSDITVESDVNFVRPTGEVEGITYTSSTGIFTSAPTNRHYFRLASSSNIEDYVFKINDVEVTPILNSDGRYYIQTDPIKAYRLDDVQNVVVEKKDGTPVFDFDYSMVTYLKLASEKGTAAQKNQAKAMYNYYKAALAFVNK